MGKAVVLDVSIILAVKTEWPFLGGLGTARLVLTLLSGGTRVDFLEPVLYVGLLFLAGNSFDGRFVVLFRRRELLLGSVDLGLGLEVAIPVDLKFISDF